MSGASDHLWAPAAARPLIAAATVSVAADPRLVGLLATGSGATGGMDEFSDVDLVIVCRDADEPAVHGDLRAFAAGLGPLLACFTGEHVGEPRLLICLFGPPLVHVDLKVVSDTGLDVRVEDGVVLWQREDTLDTALGRTAAAWPAADPQWIEDRFWIWVHYGATKVGRGELFECVDMLAFLRATVLGPLIAQARGRRAAGVRRLERVAPELVPALEATLGDHTPQGCAAALRAAVALYRSLRAGAPELAHRTGAERAVEEYLAEIAQRLGPAAGG
jgi:hypothetical protein